MKKNLKLISNIIGTVIPSLKGSDTDRSIDSTYEKDEIENESNNSSTLSLNKWNEKLLQLEEIDKFYKITGIQPKYLIYLLGTILCFIIVNYFSKAFTLLIGVIYPMHCSIRTLIKKKKNREEIKKWLEYWIVFFLFINIETIFRNVLEKINMYLFYKVVFLSICFLPWYNGAHYIYNSFLKGWFTSYEKTVCKLSQKIAEKFKKQFFVEDIYDE